MTLLFYYINLVVLKYSCLPFMKLVFRMMDNIFRQGPNTDNIFIQILLFDSTKRNKFSIVIISDGLFLSSLIFQIEDTVLWGLRLLLFLFFALNVGISTPKIAICPHQNRFWAKTSSKRNWFILLVHYK
jgi:hypothetical protein